MKDILKISAHIFLIVLGYYLLFSLACWSLYTNEWDGVPRAMLVLFSVGTTAIYFIKKYST